MPFGPLVRLSTLKDHYANLSNPHQVNKVQVGLGLLPNAKSDSYNLNSSESLATSKAVYDAIRAVKNGSASGTVSGGGVADITITHNFGGMGYLPIITDVSATVGGGGIVKYYGMQEKSNNYIKIRIDNGASPAATYTYKIDWLIIPV